MINMIKNFFYIFNNKKEIENKDDNLTFGFKFGILRKTYDEACEDQKHIELKASWLLTILVAVVSFMTWSIHKENMIQNESIIYSLFVNHNLDLKSLYYILSMICLGVAIAFLIRVFIIRDFNIINEEIYKDNNKEVILEKIKNINESNRELINTKALHFQIALILFVVGSMLAWLFISV